MRAWILILFVILALAASATAQSKKIEGVWRLNEITTTGTNGSTKQITQPSLYLFTKKHYSIIYVSSDSPRPVIEDLSTASSADLRNIFVTSFIANAGTYEMKDGKLTMRPVVAKSPTFMQAGNFLTMSVKIGGNMLTLTSDSSNNGPAANPSTFKLTRIE